MQGKGAVSGKPDYLDQAYKIGTNIIAAAAMALSSLSVVANSATLKAVRIEVD
ncbi:MAG: hypothetical protein HZA12_02390 [Nitrospirae bacterium]|nr:hypothetical protein [Nitrospirota bacterium]